MVERMCKTCGSCFKAWDTVTTICQKCAYNKYAKPAKPIKRIGKVTQAWIEKRHDWIKRNTNASGTWQCYLQIADDCPKTLTIDTLTLDHVLPKSGNPELRFVDSNLKPACWQCNSKKGSKRL